MSINPHHCIPLTDAVANRLPSEEAEDAEDETSVLPLPPGFDASLFTPEQTEYISDLFVSTVRHYLARLDVLMQSTPPGVEPTAVRLGINWALLCRFTGIGARFIAGRSKNLPQKLGTRREYFNSQLKAVVDALRSLKN